MDGVGKDSRFSHITKDPRFRRMPKHEKKVKIDKRFKDMFTDKRFKLKYSVDKRGKPMNVTTNENLKQYYELSDSSDIEEEGSDNEEEAKSSKISQNVKKSSSKTDTERKGSKFVSPNEENSETVGKKKSKKNKKTKTQIETIKPVGNSDSDEDEEVIERKMTKAGKVSISKEAQGKATQRKNKMKGKISVDQSDTDEEDEDENSSEEKDEEENSNEEEDEEEEEDSDSNDSGLGEGPDLARGEGNVETSSSSEDEDSEEEAGEEEELEHDWGELDKDVPAAEDLGRRLAVCNMDWDRIKAQDIFVTLNSFVPTGGSIQSVKVFPSEFGLQRMKEEALSGPTELVQIKLEKGAEEGEGEEEEYEEAQGTRYHREKLRQYQLNRLKYFYAVVETDSIETASKIYEECDGMEYESSSTKLDLRFIPDDMEFTEEPRSVCLEMPAAYDPTLFVSSALAQSKVNLTWDETDQDRIKVTMRNPSQSGKKTDDVNEEDFKAFLASSSEEEADDDDGKPLVGEDNNEDDDEDDNEENQIQKYRSLLQSLDDDKTRKKKKEVEMEVTWEPGLKETTEKILKKKEKTKDQTPWQQYLMKKKEKRQKKKEERMNKKVTSDQAPEEEPAAFSDDELPIDTADDPFFKQNLDSDEETEKKPKESKKSKKKEKKKKKDQKPINKEAEGELELLMMEEEADDRKHFNLKAILKESTKKKKPSQDSKGGDDFQIDVKDDRFGAIYDSYHYNIDPSAPEYKKTKSMEAIIEEKLHRRKSGKTAKAGGASGQKRKAEMDKYSAGQSAKFSKSDSESISSLINSVKSKTQTFHSTKKKK
ncbi:ESF1 homolog isoform X1 [Crassostrea angulata]|uniref:ESF1 homolog isoform X1 n=1 Tax=Magallana angulata TaxID=2784310 RepID=UPI0022B0F341|nr:ESF1 homolog isoform X1 [Crassostrea angulata]XP_052701174.1 ESF1 homolog isoform X1 [Crassostrea angulata]